MALTTLSKIVFNCDGGSDSSSRFLELALLFPHLELLRESLADLTDEIRPLGGGLVGEH